MKAPYPPTTTEVLYFQRKDAISLAYHRVIADLQRRKGKGKGGQGKGDQGKGDGGKGEGSGKGEGVAAIRKPKKNKGRTRVLPGPQ